MALGSIGKYEKLDVLGHGASGIVYLAWDKLLGKHVALKEVNLQFADEDRFLEEARVLDRLRHPNIVQVNSVDKLDGRMLIDMEYVKGTNLNEHMRGHGKLPVREALSIAVQVCDALDFAHRNHIIHRDIKPANILMNQDGAAKIVDFGLAEILGSGSYAGGAGTYAYMAPEDFEEGEKSDHRSDIWAIGITIYEMITGRRPFQAVKAKDPFSWKRAMEEDEPTPVFEIDPLLPRGLDRIISKALAKDKYDRYQSAGQIRDDLAPILTSVGGPVNLTVAANHSARPERESYDRQPEVAERSAKLDIDIQPDNVDFGNVRKGESGKRSMTIRIPGKGRINGRVVSHPAWLSISPQGFIRRKQTLEILASTESIWQPGEYKDRLLLEIDGQDVSVPITMNVLPRRRSFAEVFWWYVPLLAFCILPMYARHAAAGSAMDPAALVTTGLLSVMLFIISIVADLGILERLIPAILGATGIGVVVGAISNASQAFGTSPPKEMILMASAGTLLSLLIALQLLTSSKWRAWVVMLIISSFCASLALAR